MGEKPKRKYERDEPVSLRPLDLVTALGALLRVKPEDEDSEKGKGKGKGKPADRKGERRGKK